LKQERGKKAKKKKYGTLWNIKKKIALAHSLLALIGYSKKKKKKMSRYKVKSQWGLFGPHYFG